MPIRETKDGGYKRRMENKEREVARLSRDRRLEIEWRRKKELKIKAMTYGGEG